MHRCPSLSSHPISRIESCIPISIVLQSPFLYYFLPFLLPPPTFLLLVALPRTPCITIISLQLSASSAGELHFCKDAPYTRWVNEPDVRLLFLFLFLLHMLGFRFFFFFLLFLNLSISLYYDENVEEEWMDVELAETSQPLRVS